MKKFARILLFVLVSYLSIPVFGFIIGEITYFISVNISEELSNKHHLDDYPVLDSAFIPFLLLILAYSILFLPFYFLLYFIFRWMMSKYKVGFLQTILITLPLYFIFGVLMYGGQFGHILLFNHDYYGEISFLGWLSAEHLDFNTTAARLLSSILFIWLCFFRKSNYAPGVNQINSPFRG